MSSAWGSSWGVSWGDSWGGIGLAEEAGIGLAVTPPVDFVIQPRSIANYRQVIDIRAYRPAPRIDRSELKEMMQMYALWKRAA